MLKGEDTFRTECANSISEDSIVSLLNLYQPLIGGEGVLLYLTLHAEAKHQRTQSTHKHLSRILNMPLEMIERTRWRLEEYNLMRSFSRQNQANTSYIYHLNPPMPSVDFISNHIFMSQFVNAVGKKDADEVVARLGSVGISVQGYQEITKPFRHVEVNEDVSYDEAAYTRITPQYTFSGGNDISFDYERFLAGTSSLVFPLALRTEENMALIGRLGTLYGIAPDEMRRLVKRCCELDPPVFHAHRLKDLCSRQKVQTPETKDRYSLPPASFLQSYMNGRPLPLSDKKILEYLSVDMHFSNEVINIMIEYILKKSNNRLSPKFVQLVAGEWARDGIETREQAIEETHKNFSSSSRTRVIDLPDYMKQAQQEEEKEDEALMEELLKRQKKSRQENGNG